MSIRFKKTKAEDNAERGGVPRWAIGAARALIDEGWFHAFVIRTSDGWLVTPHDDDETRSAGTIVLHYRLERD